MFGWTSGVPSKYPSKPLTVNNLCIYDLQVGLIVGKNLNVNNDFDIEHKKFEPGSYRNVAKFDNNIIHCKKKESSPKITESWRADALIPWWNTEN